MMSDICANRHMGRSESVAAHQRIENRVGDFHGLIIAALKHGSEYTCKELETVTGLTRSTCSARVSELKKLGKVVKTGARRDGCAVLRLA